MVNNHLELELTTKVHLNKRCKDGKSRNFIVYFLNNVEILKLKIPFDTNFEAGHDKVTFFTDHYIKDGRLHIKKVKHLGYKDGLPKSKEWWASYPISKRKLNNTIND